mgnify:CR=1 FL=1
MRRTLQGQTVATPLRGDEEPRVTVRGDLSGSWLLPLLGAMRNKTGLADSGQEALLLPLLGAMRNNVHTWQRGQSSGVATPLRGDEELVGDVADTLLVPALLPLLGAMRNTVHA